MLLAVVLKRCAKRMRFDIFCVDENTVLAKTGRGKFEIRSLTVVCVCIYYSFLCCLGHLFTINYELSESRREKYILHVHNTFMQNIKIT